MGCQVGLPPPCHFETSGSSTRGCSRVEGKATVDTQGPGFSLWGITRCVLMIHYFWGEFKKSSVYRLFYAITH